MRVLEIITGHVIYNPAYSYKFQLKTTEVSESELTEAFAQLVQTSKSLIDPVVKILVNMLESKAPEERDEQKVNSKGFKRLNYKGHKLQWLISFLSLSQKMAV